MAAAPIRIQSSSNTSVLTTVTATYGQTPIQNNLLIAATTSTVGAGSTTITGWSTATSIALGVAGSLVLFYKVAGAAESTSVVANATLATFMDLHVYEYSNIDTISPLGVVASTADSAAGVTSRSSGTTAVSANGISLIFVAVAQVLTNGGGTSWTNSISTGITTTHLITGDLVSFTNAAQESTASWVTSQRAAGIIATFFQTQGNVYYKGGGR